MKYFTILASIGLLASLVATAPTKDPKLVKFHPITQSQYEEILGLTKGKPVISEGRLISSGVAKITGFASGLATSWLPSIIRDFANNSTIPNKDKTYPLCVFDSDEIFNDYLNRPSTRGYYDSAGIYHLSPNEYGIPAYDEEVDGEVDTTTETNPSQTIVNCIVVIKPGDQGTTATSSSTSTTTTTTKKPTTKKPPGENYPPWHYPPIQPYPHYPPPFTYPYLYPPYLFPYPPPPMARQNSHVDDVYPQFNFDSDYPQLPYEHSVKPLRAPAKQFKQSKKIQSIQPVFDYKDFDSEEFENDDDFITVRKNQG